jgi:hypothetical protein
MAENEESNTALGEGMEMFNCSCENSALASMVELMLEGVGIPLVGGLGILGNLAIIFVLR